MAIGDAMRFLKDLDHKPELREALYASQGSANLFETLSKAGYPFSGGEFEEAVDHVHVACQTYAEADQLMTRVNWFRLVSANA